MPWLNRKIDFNKICEDKTIEHNEEFKEWTWSDKKTFTYSTKKSEDILEKNALSLSEMMSREINPLEKDTTAYYGGESVNQLSLNERQEFIQKSSTYLMDKLEDINKKQAEAFAQAELELRKSQEEKQGVNNGN